MDYVRSKIERENEPKHPGVIMRYEARGVDDGDYGDPHVDTRPDWIKEDEKGWRRLP